MPLVPQYTWEQDASSLALELRLPGITLKHIDIYVSDVVIKVNAAPYVLLLDLYDAVDDTSAVITSLPSSSLLRLSVTKEQSRVWKFLQHQGTKAVRRERRDASMERKRASETALSDKRKERRHEEEKETLRAQMAVDDTNRQILSDLKAEEKEQEERCLYESFREIQVEKHEKKKLRSSERHDDASSRTRKTRTKKKVSWGVVSHDEVESGGMRQRQEDEVIEVTQDGTFDVTSTCTPKVIQTIETLVFDSAASDDDPKQRNASSCNEAIDTNDERHAPQAVELPPPRERVQAEIRFTPRVFPTPSRESKAAEEEDWLLKNRKHINKHQGLNRTSDYDISETDPMWLKAKGDDFFHSKDFSSAANAYAEAISATPSGNTELIATCLSNRAACLLQVGKFEECISDCSKALSYLPDTREPAATSTTLKHYRLKLKLVVRRGTAYCRVGHFSHAKADYGVACSMDSHNSQLQDDFMELSALEKAQELKQAGDDMFRDGQSLAQAIQMYSTSLHLNPVSIACLSNRAACYLVQHCAKECIEDCTRALELLQRDGPSTGTSSSDQERGLAFCSIGPAAGSSERRVWVLKTLVRRGAAYLSLGDLDKAEQDYAASVQLDPCNEALKADLARLQDEREQNEAKCSDLRASPTPLEA